MAHLVSEHYDGDLAEAVRAAYNELEGHYAFVAIAADQPDVVVGARKECPLVVGVGETASSSSPRPCRRSSGTPATSSTSPTTRSSSCARDGVRVRPCRRRSARSSTRSSRSTGTRTPPRRAATRPSCSRRSTSRPTPSPRRSASARPATTDRVDLGRHGRDRRRAAGTVRRIVIVGCGTSLPRRAGRSLRDRGVGARAGRDGDRVRVPLPQPGLGPDDLVVGITQSGETADTLAAMRIAQRARRAACSPITNVMGSQATRDSDGVLYTRPAWRSASRRPRPSSARSRRCTCSACASPSCAARWTPRAAAS